MATTIQAGDVEVRVTAQPLTQESYAQFGDVTQNPRPNIHPGEFDQHASELPPNAFTANQGFAIQYRNAARIQSLYEQAPSGSGSPIMSVFVCAARQLPLNQTSRRTEFTVKYLERHPYTTQTFSPISSMASTYLVIVAPTLPASPQDSHFVVPSGPGLPGRGLPDLANLKAFVAQANQAVTYAAGTWHAPMVVLGESGTTLDFVVSQFASGVADEDCQLLEFAAEAGREPKLTVEIPSNNSYRRPTATSL
ncbi:hypothetical protein VHEMI02568 [[Torrubiella] hemipterigena]|uniref:Ureidoglycolate hydrolase n=1 Tax=[Torrubiella] hemipterigena TaxID=1531966 RepID=A0A0A1SPZ7_9HYPO|nr:hypothetical protein VHEMI02568 [[Torrubiella] hemipterigena]